MRQTIKALIFRFAVYTVTVFAFTLSLPLLVAGGDMGAFDENGPIEILQLSVVAASSVVLAFGAFTVSRYREILLLFASLAAFAAIRELDALLDQYIPIIGWKFAYLLIVYIAVSLYKNWRAVRHQLETFLFCPGFTVLWASFLVVVAVGQLLGHGPLLEPLMGQDYDRSVKRVIEESTELVGYLLLLAGSVESVINVRAVEAAPAPSRHAGWASS